MLGDGRVQLSCYDGVPRLGLIRGTMKRRVWISPVCLHTHMSHVCIISGLIHVFAVVPYNHRVILY
jgi:hypothetical protein